MSILSSYERFHFRLFNVLARLFGLMAVLAAVNGAVAGIYHTVYPPTEYIETLGLPEGLMDFLVSVFFATIGILILRVKPYRPDLGDGAWTLLVGKSGETTEQRRSWWTGEPRR